MSGGSRDDVGRFTVSCTSIQFLCLIFLVSCPIFVDKCKVSVQNPGGVPNNPPFEMGVANLWAVSVSREADPAHDRECTRG